MPCGGCGRSECSEGQKRERVGVYTQQAYSLRVSDYDAWIASVTASGAH
jgi:hypothetical protein